MSELVFSVPGPLRRGHKKTNEKESVQSGLELIQLICRTFQLDDLGDSSVLDMGCGCKLVQATKQHDLPMGRYFGVDVFPDMIEFLQENANDSRFSFDVLNTHNEMYNPGGQPLSKDTKLSAEEGSFDIICLFSVFTHLAPHDYVAMLQMLRPYVKPNGRIIFSLFVNEPTKGDMGFIDGLHRDWDTDDKGRVEEHKEEFLDAIEKKQAPDFLDFFAEQPLKVAMYSRENALRLVENTGWEMESLHDPEKSIQHFMVCKPI
jgi:SAM-dependent methyltransferase